MQIESIMDPRTSRMVELRRSGKTCKKVAEALSVPVWSVWRATRDAGLSGEIRNYSHKRATARKPRPMIDRLLDRVDSILIERGSAGGIIVTLDDRWTGTEQETAGDAIKSAVDAMDVIDD